jgi:tryptophanyl-tRNA synthetase
MEASASQPKKHRIVSGMRPTGNLHVGHYFGALVNWLQLQDEYSCFYFSADWHALTSEWERSQQLPEYVRENVIDFLAAGIDPEKSVLFVQSSVVEHAELYVIMQNLVPVGWLERTPSWKEQREALGEAKVGNLGFFGYPVLQTADVLMYKGDRVPVGEDQVPHIELSREIARRFNSVFGEVFPEPKPVLTQVPRLPGTDGRKMSKSYGNAIYLGEPVEDAEKKIRSMVTDVNRPRRTDPGNPDECVLFNYHKLYTSEEERSGIITDCKSAKLGCVDCKKNLAGKVIPWLKDFQEKRASFADHNRVGEIIAAGNEKARKVARVTMEEVREKVGV